MSRYNPRTLYELLPAVHRQRDAERGYPLRDLVTILGEQAQVLEEEIEQLYRNWFIETCDDWVVPYIGDLLGVRATSAGSLGARAEVANTLGYRRRKGTLAVVEQLARDVTGRPARAVEYFRLLTTTQNLNHPRMDNHGSPDLRDSATLLRLGGAFERTARSLEVRRIEHGAGRYNIPNVGVHLWRLSAYGMPRAMPHAVEDGSGLHFTFSPLGNDMPLFRRPEAVERPFDLATERNVPDPIRRRVLHDQFHELYGAQSSVAVWDGENLVEPEQVAVCNLVDWQRATPDGKTLAIDPELGRIAFASEPGDVRVLYHYGFSANLGGGPYERGEAPGESAARIFHVAAASAPAADNDADRFQTIAEALAAWSSTPVEERRQRSSVIRIEDNRSYREALPPLALPERTRLSIRAANHRRPTLLLTNELNVVGERDSALELDGLLIAHQGLRIDGQLRALRLGHCTLVPGRRLGASGQPLEPGATSLRIGSATSAVEIEHSIVGPFRVAVDARVKIHDSILDANDMSGVAYEGLQDGEPGGSVDFQRATVIGLVRAREIGLASDTLFLGLVEVTRRQQGCLRFSHVPPGSVVPQRFHCQPAVPEVAAAVRPRFTSLRYGDPGYCQLTPHAPIEIQRGAEDESEMGAFSSLRQPQREASLRLRLDEYLKLGMVAGVFYET